VITKDHWHSYIICEFSATKPQKTAGRKKGEKKHLSWFMRARLPQTKKENTKMSAKKDKINKCGKKETNSSRWAIGGERERVSEKEKVTETERERERGEKKQEKCQFSSGKMGFTEQKLLQ
jgi:hypothetical protein